MPLPYQQIAPIYTTSRLGRLGYIQAQYGTQGLGQLGQVLAYQGQAPGPQVRSTRVFGLGQLGQLRQTTQEPSDEVGPYMTTAATTLGAGLGGGIIGLVAGKASTDSMWRGAIFSASLAGISNSMSHLRQDKNKAFGGAVLLAGLYGMWWAFKPMLKGQLGAG